MIRIVINKVLNAMCVSSHVEPIRGKWCKCGKLDEAGNSELYE